MSYKKVCIQPNKKKGCEAAEIGAMKMQKVKGKLCLYLGVGTMVEVDWYLILGAVVEVDWYLFVGKVVEVDWYLILGTVVEVDWYLFVGTVVEVDWYNLDLILPWLG